MTFHQMEQDEKERLLYNIYTDIRNPASFSSLGNCLKQPDRVGIVT